MNEKFNLALEEFIHVGVVLVLIIALVSVFTGLIRAFIPQEKLQKRLSKAGRYSGLMGALLGIPTPFCSASMVPVSMGMIEMGAPFSMVLSFLLSAPLANFVVVGFILGVFGWKVALVYFLVVFIGSVLMGTIAGKTSLKNEVKRINLNSGASRSKCTPQPSNGASNNFQQLNCVSPELESNSKSSVLSIQGCSQVMQANPKLKEATTFAWALFKRIFPYVLVGALISAVSAIFVPDAWVQKHLGNDSPLAIPIAATIGIPLYLRIEMAIPILKALIVKGMSMGAAIALIIGGTGASLPEIAIISSMLKPRAIAAFIISVMIMAMVGGLHFLFFLLNRGMKKLLSLLKCIVGACPYSMLGKKCIDVAKGEKYDAPQNNEKILKYRNGVKTGRNITLIGVFCPFLWYSIFSGKSQDFIFLNMMHSGIVAGIGLLLVIINHLALVSSRRK